MSSLDFLAVVVLASSVCATGCAAAERAAARDPMKCERDPNCAKYDRARDCSTQCVDDSACVDRCQQVNQANGPLGH